MIRKEMIQQLVGVLGGQIGLEQFELWLVSNLQSINDGDDADLQKYADELDVLMIRLSENVVSLGQFVEDVEDILRNLNTINFRQIPLGAEPISFTTIEIDAQTIRVEFKERPAVEDYYLEKATI